MAHSLSAKKRVRQNAKRNTINRARKSAVKTQTKHFLDAIELIANNIIGVDELITTTIPLNELLTTGFKLMKNKNNFSYLKMFATTMTTMLMMVMYSPTYKAAES